MKKLSYCVEISIGNKKKMNKIITLRKAKLFISSHDYIIISLGCKLAWQLKLQAKSIQRWNLWDFLHPWFTIWKLKDKKLIHGNFFTSLFDNLNYFSLFKYPFCFSGTWDFEWQYFFYLSSSLFSIVLRCRGLSTYLNELKFMASRSPHAKDYQRKTSWVPQHLNGLDGFLINGEAKRK